MTAVRAALAEAWEAPVGGKPPAATRQKTGRPAGRPSKPTRKKSASKPVRRRNYLDAAIEDRELVRYVRATARREAIDPRAALRLIVREFRYLEGIGA